MHARRCPRNSCVDLGRVVVAIRRTTLRRRGRFLVVGGLVVLAGATAVGSALAQESPTITFTSTGAVPLSCGSAPSVSGMTIFRGTRIVLVNRTGVEARVYIDSYDGALLDDGEAVP